MTDRIVGKYKQTIVATTMLELFRTDGHLRLAAIASPSPGIDRNAPSAK